MITLGTNLAANQAAYYVNQANKKTYQSILQLASGSRLAIPSDDPAGVAVSGTLTARLGRLSAASDGTSDVISAAQTADGFLSTIQNQLTRLSELAQEATNGAFGSTDRANYQTEFAALQGQINSITSNATFDGIPLFASGSIGVAVNSQGFVDSFSLSTVGNTTSLGIQGTSISTTTAALSTLTAINAAISCITTRRAAVNSDISKFNFYLNNISSESTNVAAANSQISDVNIAQTSTSLSQSTIQGQFAISLLAQANSQHGTVLSLLTSK